MRRSDENLRGRTLIAADSRVVGEVTALFRDSEVWRVESLQVKLDKGVADPLGAERSIFHAGALEIPVCMVQSVGDTVVLSVDVDALQEKSCPSIPNLRPPSKSSIRKTAELLRSLENPDTPVRVTPSQS